MELAKSLSQTITDYLSIIRSARSANTARTYQNALHAFSEILRENQYSPEENPPTDLSDEAVVQFVNALKYYSPATERLYLTAVMGFYEYLSSEQLSSVNLPRLRLLIKKRARRPGQRLPQFPQNDIVKVIEYTNNIASVNLDDELVNLRNLRDRAFILTLADTGLRVHEACALRRGDIDWNEGRAIIIGKGNQQAVVRFSGRSLQALREYLSQRARLDGASGRPLASLPIFARHDRGAGKKVKPITTTTGRNIIAQRVREILGNEAAGKITPHSFRHYFVSVILRASGNLKLAQELARHRNIAITQRYAHLSDDELDKGYWNIFDTTE